MANKDVRFGRKKRKKGTSYWRKRAARKAAALSKQTGQLHTPAVHTPAAVENVAARAGQTDQDLVSKGIQGPSRIRCQPRPKKQKEQQQLACMGTRKVSTPNPASSRGSRGPPRTERPVLTCDPCNKQYLGREALVQHVTRCHVSTPRFQCSLCPSLHPELRHLRLHWQSTHQGTLQYTPLECELCGKLRDSRTDLQAHVRRVHGAYLVCHVCGHVSISPALLQTHYLTQHGPQAWSKHVVKKIKKVNRKISTLALPICFICKEPYGAYLNSLRNHILFNHLKLPRYQCSHCDFAGVERHHMQKHIKDQHPGVGNTEFTTTKEMKGICKTHQERSKKFKTSRLIPLKNSGVPYYGSELQCEFCAKLYTSKNALRVHMVQEHLDVYHFKCLNCNFAHATKSVVRYHWFERHWTSPRIITNDLYCEICMEHFRTDPDLRDHILARHGGELQCIPCFKIFSSVGQLREHLLLKHQPEAWDLRKDALYKRARRKVYKCAKDSVTGQYTCFMCRIVSYSTNDSLFRHVVSAHLKITLYECKVCPYKCRDRSKMISHRYKCHLKSTKPVQNRSCDHELDSKISNEENGEFTITEFPTEVSEPDSLNSCTGNQKSNLDCSQVNTVRIAQENLHDGILYLDSEENQSAAYIETGQGLKIKPQDRDMGFAEQSSAIKQEPFKSSFEFVECDPLLEDPEVIEDPLAISCPMDSEPQDRVANELEAAGGEKGPFLSFPQDLRNSVTTLNIEKEVKQDEEECFIKEEPMEFEV